MDVHYPFSVDGCWIVSSFLAIRNKAPINILLQVFADKHKLSFLLGRNLGMEKLGLRVGIL